MASAGVFLLVVCAEKLSTSGQGRQIIMLLTKIKHKQSRSYQKNDLSKELTKGVNAQNKQNANRELSQIG
jgi:hypothetical protein